MIKNVVHRLQQIFCDSNRDTTKYLLVEPNWNLTTIFGFLLDYPTVYWFEDTKNGETCLSCKDLINYQVKPIETSDALLVSQRVYSFTVPLCVINDSLQRTIDTWFSHVNESTKKQNVILTCETTKVNFTSVLL